MIDERLKKRRVLKFSMATLLFVILCTCGWLAGYRNGYQTGDESWHYKDVRIITYNVADLVSPVSNPLGLAPPKIKIDNLNSDPSWSQSADFEPLMSMLKRVLDPDQIEDAQIVAFPTNLSLVVTGNGIIHRRVTSVLKDLRGETDG